MAKKKSGWGNWGGWAEQIYNKSPYFGLNKVPGTSTPVPSPSVPAAAPPVFDPSTYGAASPATYNLGYDSELDSEETAARGQLASTLTELGLNDANTELNYTTQKRAVDQAAPAIYRRLLNDSAARGMAYSSGYAYQNQEAQNQIADQLNQLATERAASLGANTARRATAQSNLDALLASIARRRAARQTA